MCKNLVAPFPLITIILSLKQNDVPTIASLSTHVHFKNALLMQNQEKKSDCIPQFRNQGQFVQE